MHDDHLWWPVGSALKAGGQALGPLPYAGDVNGFRLARMEQHPLLLGRAPLSSGHNFGWAQRFGFCFYFIFFLSVSAQQNTSQGADRQALWDARRISIATSHDVKVSTVFYGL